MRCLALPDGDRLETSASLAGALAEADGTTPPARASLRNLRARLEAGCAGLAARLASLPEAAPPEARALALVGPTALVTPAELALLSLVAEGLRLALPLERRRALGPLLDGLWADEGAPSEAPDLSPYLAPTDPAPPA